MKVKAGMMQKDNIIIRDALVTDIERLCDIDNDCFSQPWSAVSFLNEMEHDFSVCYVAYTDDTVVGYINARTMYDETDINNVAVSPLYRKRGIGEKLVRHLCDKEQDSITKINLEVRLSNCNAIHLYTKCGFEKTGERKNFYEHPVETAVLMSKSK